MHRFPARRLAGLVLITLAATACSAEEPSPPPAAAPTAAAQPAEVAPPPAAADDADSVALAQAMDDAESSDEPTTEAGDEPIRLAATTQSGSPASDARFKEGTHYRLLPVAQPTSAPPDKVEVVEIFWYGCPHCYSLEPYFQVWRDQDMPPNTAFVRMPAALNRGWQLHARVFYTAEALGVLDEVHEDLFREIHGKGNRLDTEESLIEFFGRYGVSEEQFVDAFNSFAVSTKLRRADSLVRRYRITGVPAVVVNGKYVTGADLAGGEAQMFEVINFLVEQESS